MREESRENYILKITTNTQNFITRLKMEEEKVPENFHFWCDTIVELVCFALVVSKHFDKLTLEELREFNYMYDAAAIAHDSKNSQEDRESALATIKALISQSIPKYAYLLDMPKEELIAQMQQEKMFINESQTALVKRNGGLIIDRQLKLRQSPKEPEEMAPVGEIVSVEQKIHEETATEFARRRMQEESYLKRSLASLLKSSYENIKEFETRYNKYSDFRHNVKDISRTINPIIRNEKVKKMQEHLLKLERYHKTISTLYNTLYEALIYHYDELTRDDLIHIESLFLIYETMTEILRDCIGDYTVTTMERRRLRLQEQIQKYNEYIDQIVKEQGTGNSTYTANIFPFSEKTTPKKA